MNRQMVKHSSLARMCFGVATFVLLISLVIAGVAPGSEKRPPIIDVHVHVYGQDARWTYPVPYPVSGQPMTSTNEEAHMRN